MVLVHVDNDVGFCLSNCRGGTGKAKLGTLDPADLPETRDEMPALDEDTVQMEVGETGINAASWMVRGEPAQQTIIVATLGTTDQRETRPGERVGEFARAVKQQGNLRRGGKVTGVLGEV